MGLLQLFQAGRLLLCLTALLILHVCSQTVTTGGLDTACHYCLGSRYIVCLSVIRSFLATKRRGKYRVSQQRGQIYFTPGAAFRLQLSGEYTRLEHCVAIAARAERLLIRLGEHLLSAR
jgi:hypothetical protein